MQVLIEKLDHQGQGIAYVDGIVTFVPKCIPGDVVTIKITKKSKHYNQGEILEIIQKVPNREEAFCPFYYKCGGCQLQNLTYDETLDYKRKKISNIFQKINLVVEPEMIKNPEPLYYRNKIELKMQNGHLGFYQKATNEIVEITKCPITSKSINELIPVIAKLNLKNADVIIRSNLKGEVLLIFKTQEKLNINSLTNFHNLKGIIVNDKLVYGVDYLIEEINGLKFKITYDAFFQVNPFIAQILFNLIKENIPRNETVLDLYSGVGTLTLNAALKAKEALGIEIVANASKNGEANSALNKIKNVTFKWGDVEKEITRLKNNYATWIVDPPRKGLDNKTIAVILEKRPKKIIYVSCNIHTLVRDLAKIKDIYEVTKVYGLDMFSYTYHEEVLGILNLR